MFWHLKAADFVNLMEGHPISAKLQRHLDSCAQCRSTWHAAQSVHAEVASLEGDIPEPDWDHFRSTVRDQLLSRSVQRQSAVRRWTGWSIRPAAAWALSLLMAVGVTTLTVMWRTESPVPAPTTVIVAPAVPETTVEVIESGPERSLFDDVISLGEEQQEQFRKMLESVQ